MDKKERFNKLVRYLVFVYELPYAGILRAIAEKAGVNSSNLSAALSGNERFLTNSIIKKVNKSFGEPFNMEWLLSGTGEMYNENASPTGPDINWVVQSQQETISKLVSNIETLSKLLKQ